MITYAPSDFHLPMIPSVHFGSHVPMIPSVSFGSQVPMIPSIPFGSLVPMISSVPSCSCGSTFPSASYQFCLAIVLNY